MEKSIRPFMAILIILLAVVVSGGLTYLYVDNQTSKEESNLQSQINDLEKQLTILKNSNTIIDETVDWKTYTNTKYGFSIKYPQTAKVYSGGMEQDLTKVSELVISSNGKESNEGMGIMIYDQTEKAIDQASRDILSKNLKDYAQTIWNLNKNDNNPSLVTKSVGDMSTITLDNQIAYEFSVTRGFKNQSGEFSLYGGENIFKILSKGNYKYIIYYPTSDSILKDIIATFHFTK